MIKPQKNPQNNLLCKDILTTQEAARLLRVSVQTIKNYIYSKRIKSFKTPGGHHRIFRKELMPFLRDSFVTELRNGAQRLESNHDILKNNQLYCLYLSTIKVFLEALEERDALGPGHSERVSRYSMAIAERLKLSEEEKRHLELAGLLHDIGKIGISEQILSKPSSLTPQEFSQIKRHPEIGERMLQDIDFLRPVSKLIRYHHERWDGTGYPDGLKKEQIPLGARIIFVAETYDALAGGSSYQKPRSQQEAIKELKKVKDRQLDGHLVSLFIDFLKT